MTGKADPKTSRGVAYMLLAASELKRFLDQSGSSTVKDKPEESRITQLNFDLILTTGFQMSQEPSQLQKMFDKGSTVFCYHVDHLTKERMRDKFTVKIEFDRSRKARRKMSFPSI